MANPLASPSEYEAFVYDLPNRYSSIQRSSLVYISLGSRIGRITGMILFPGDIILCVQGFLNFELGVIEGYGYEVSHSRLPLDRLPEADEYCRPSYTDKDKLYWYDSFPHPNDPNLASTHPHHKHVPPDIKRNRIPAPELTLTAPNLASLIEEIQQTVLTT